MVMILCTSAWYNKIWLIILYASQNWGPGPHIWKKLILYYLNDHGALPAISFQNLGPQFLKTGPQFLKSAETPQKQPIWGGGIVLVPEKSSSQEMGVPCPFFAKKWKNSVKFGLSSRSNISLPRTGGHHPVPSLSILSTERLGTAMY